MTGSAFDIPPIGSIWFNNRRGKNYAVAGLVAHCEDDGAEDWEVLYRSYDMPAGHYRRRSLESWYGNNRDGDPRFVRVDEVSHSPNDPLTNTPRPKNLERIYP